MLSVNEDAEILSRLGVLGSKLESPHKTVQNEWMGNGSIYQNSTADDCSISTGDEESDSNVVYVKRRLLGNEQQRRRIAKRQNNGMTCRNVLLAASFIALGISTALQSITLPNIMVNAHANSFLFVLHVSCITALGFIIGCIIVSVLLTRMNPLLLLLLPLAGVILFTALLGSSRTALAVYLHSLILGCFCGTVFRGGLVIFCGNGFGTRTVFAMHAFFALGTMMISLLSAFFLSGTAMPNAHYITLLKRDTNLFMMQPGDGLSVGNNSSERSTTSKPLRPDHVVGVESIAEPKTQENEQKRRKVVERIKAKEEERKSTTNSSSHSKRPEIGHTRDGNNSKYLHMTSAAPVVSSTPAVGSTKSFGTVTVSKAASTTHLVPESTSAATVSNFPFGDVSKSLSRLNWKIGIAIFSDIWIWEELEQKYGPFQNVHMVYLIAAFLGLCCLVPYFVAAACINCCHVTVPNLHISKLQAAPNRSLHDKEMKISWYIYSGMFLLLIGGIELTVGESLTLYALCRPELNFSQLNGLFLTSAFWFGIFAARLPFILMTKFINICRLSSIMLLSTVIAGYIAISARSLITLLPTLFILGFSIGPLSPSLLCWLDEQELLSRPSLSLLYTIGIFLGRFILPFIVALFIHIFHTSVALFAVTCGSLFIAYMILIITVRTVRGVARLSAMNQFSSTIGENAEINVGEIVEQKNARNGKYMALVDEGDVKCIVYGGEEDDFVDDISLTGPPSRCEY